MNSLIYTPFQIREVFHLEFLRWFTRKFEAAHYALKGGVNLRLFFRSIRYSEDMDVDIMGIPIERVKKSVLEIVSTRGFLANLNSFGIEKVVPPDPLKAKQTETTQRFKIHLLTSKGEDFFTKIDFSRRGLKGSRVVEAVSREILQTYKMAPLLVSHYDAASAVLQKIQALAGRPVLQARDIFDLFMLTSQAAGPGQRNLPTDKALLKKAHGHIFLVGFPQFRDTVAAYLTPEDQAAYSSSGVWDEIKLKTAHFLEGLAREDE